MRKRFLAIFILMPVSCPSPWAGERAIAAPDALRDALLSKCPETPRFLKEAPDPIILDPGHGGRDLGAVVRGRMEKDIALAVAHKLKQQLSLKGGRPVWLTRESDEYVELDRRVGESRLRLRPGARDPAQEAPRPPPGLGAAAGSVQQHDRGERAVRAVHGARHAGGGL